VVYSSSCRRRTPGTYLTAQIAASSAYGRERCWRKAGGRDWHFIPANVTPGSLPVSYIQNRDAATCWDPAAHRSNLTLRCYARHSSARTRFRTITPAAAFITYLSRLGRASLAHRLGAFVWRVGEDGLRHSGGAIQLDLCEQHRFSLTWYARNFVAGGKNHTLLPPNTGARARRNAAIPATRCTHRTAKARCFEFITTKELMRVEIVWRCSRNAHLSIKRARHHSYFRDLLAPLVRHRSSLPDVLT